MTIVVDPQFSVFRLVERIENKSTILKHRRTMSLMSYEIENATLRDGARTRVFAGFQRMSKFLPQVKRYQTLAEKAASVYVFGIPDVQPPAIPNITYVPLTPDDRLSKEWFLISYGQDYFSALATEEMTRPDDPDETRVFKGIWTFDLSMVTILYDWLSSSVDALPQHFTDENRNYARQVDLMSVSMAHLMRAMERMNRDDSETSIAQSELKTVVDEQVRPVLAELKGAEFDEGKRQQEAVILFSDLRGYTTIAEKMEPYRLVQQVINPYLSIVSKAVYHHSGKVDKFLGDGVLAVFGADQAAGNGADQALSAAQEILQTFKLTQAEDQSPSLGIGLAAGIVHVGQIGSPLRHEEAVIGDAVNVAQRLSALGENSVLISEAVYERLSSRDTLELQGTLSLKGKAEPQRIYQIRRA